MGGLGKPQRVGGVGGGTLPSRERWRQRMPSVALWLMALVFVASSHTPASAQRAQPFHFAIELHGSVLSNQPERSLLNATVGGALRFGYRTAKGWGGFAHLEQNVWFATELEKGIVPGAWNVGIGIERLWAERLIRSSFTAGLSILAFSTDLHERGAVRVFGDLRPATLRWQLGRRTVFELTPLHVVVMVPVPSPPRLLSIQYRTSLALGVALQ